MWDLRSEIVKKGNVCRFKFVYVIYNKAVVCENFKDTQCSIPVKHRVRSIWENWQLLIV